MRNKALHIIFPDNATAHLDNPAQTAFADLVPAQQSQLSDSSSNAASTVNGSPGLFGVTTNPAQASNEAALPDVLTDVSKNLDLLRAVTEAQTTEITANTAALGTNTAAKSVGQTVASVGKADSSFLGGLTSFPLISGLVKLFGGGSDTPAAQPALPKYEAPASLSFDRAVVSGSAGSQIGAPTYDQYGNPKTNSSEEAFSQNVAQLFTQLIPDAQGTSDSAARLSLSDQTSFQNAAQLINQLSTDSKSTADQITNATLAEQAVLQSAAQLFGQLIPNAQNTPDPASAFSFDQQPLQQASPDTSLPDYTALLATVRAYTGQLPGDPATQSSTQDLTASPAAPSVAGNNTQITVNVQAMDSRSFLDRSQDIAQAVREAMLNMHSINDVVNDL